MEDQLKTKRKDQEPGNEEVRLVLYYPRYGKNIADDENQETEDLTDHKDGLMLSARFVHQSVKSTKHGNRRLFLFSYFGKKHLRLRLSVFKQGLLLLG